MKANYYEILGVEKTASREAIKAAFREKARKHHPDVNNNSLESTVWFRIIFNAYSVLRNQPSRRTYDTYLEHSSVFGHRFSNDGNHRPFVSVEDYFYNIRNRTNAFLRRVKLLDLASIKTNDGTSIIEKILDTYNRSVRRIESIRETSA